MNQDHYMPLAERAIEVIYKMAEHPDLICGNIIKQIAAQIITLPPPPSDTEQEDTEPDASQGRNTSAHIIGTWSGVQVLGQVHKHLVRCTDTSS